MWSDGGDRERELRINRSGLDAGSVVWESGRLVMSSKGGGVDCGVTEVSESVV